MKVKNVVTIEDRPLTKDDIWELSAAMIDEYREALHSAFAGMDLEFDDFLRAYNLLTERIDDEESQNYYEWARDFMGLDSGWWCIDEQDRDKINALVTYAIESYSLGK